MAFFENCEPTALAATISLTTRLRYTCLKLQMVAVSSSHSSSHSSSKQGIFYGWGARGHMPPIMRRKNIIYPMPLDNPDTDASCSPIRNAVYSPLVVIILVMKV